MLMSLSRDTSYILPNPDPGKNFLVYSEDNRGDEYKQIYLYDLNTKDTRRLSDGRSRNVGLTFDDKGERLAFLARERNSDQTRFEVLNPLQPSSMKTICRYTGNWSLGPWSPDGERILAWKTFPPNLSFLYTLNVRTGKLRPLGSGKEGEVTHRSAVWSLDGRYVYYAGDWNSEFLTLRRIELTSGREVELTHESPWDVAGLDISKDDSSLAVSFNKEGTQRLYLFDTRSNETRAVPGIADGSMIDATFHPRDAKLAWTLLRLDSTVSVGSYDLATGATTEWRAREPREPRPPAGRLVHYPTFDRVDGQPRTIPAWFWQAKSIDGRPTPVLINIHGGPEGQSGPVDGSIGIVARRGISVIEPNVRGSTGYGKTYRRLDDGRLRMDAVKDIGALLDWIRTQPELDSKRVAVFGGSYGGFMALASAVEFSDRLACGIDFFGISDFTNMIRETREGMREWARVEFGDERDPEMRSFFQSISPLDHHERIRIPLLIFQGANDTRVPVGESRRMVEKLRARGQNVWYIEASDQGHQMPNPVNSFFVVPAGLTFLERCLVEGMGRP
jgi:dipeptidyl aminopeptidase/acylaminoacyl peptidase